MRIRLLGSWFLDRFAWMHVDAWVSEWMDGMDEWNGWTHEWMYACMCMCMHVYVHVYVLCMCMCVCLCVCGMYVYACTNCVHFHLSPT